MIRSNDFIFHLLPFILYVPFSSLKPNFVCFSILPKPKIPRTDENTIFLAYDFFTLFSFILVQISVFSSNFGLIHTIQGEFFTEILYRCDRRPNSKWARNYWTEGRSFKHWPHAMFSILPLSMFIFNVYQCRMLTQRIIHPEPDSDPFLIQLHWLQSISFKIKIHTANLKFVDDGFFFIYLFSFIINCISAYKWLFYIYNIGDLFDGQTIGWIDSFDKF